VIVVEFLGYPLERLGDGVIYPYLREHDYKLFYKAFDIYVFVQRELLV